MAIIVSAYVQATEQNHRNQTAALLNNIGTGFDVQPGVQFGMGIAKTSGMSATIDLGRAIVPNATADQGPYMFAITGSAQNITFNDGDPSRNRIDVVMLGFNLGSPSVWVVQGTYPVSGSPVAPATPAGAIALWQVPINAGMNTGSGGWNASLAVDVRPAYAARGGKVFVSGQTQRDNLTKYTGLSVWRGDKNYEQVWDGSIWRQPYTAVVASQAERDALDKYVGMSVYRTDIFAKEYWDGTIWRSPSGGLQALVESTSIGTSSTVLQVEMNIPSFTFRANRKYLVEGSCAVVVATATGAPLVQLFTCSTADPSNSTTGLTEIMGYNVISNGNYTIRANPKRIISYSVDTTLQIKMTLNGNTVSCYRAAGATWPTQLSITDLGRNF